jgi:carbon monoxide dehydrogenase subunit G
MELTNDFEVAVPVERAWDVLVDVERIAPCLPGAELREVEGDEYRGQVKVKVGPITASYKGVARFTQLDEANRRAVLLAEGRDTRGQGNATATITATMVPSTTGTKVTVTTDLAITGKVAQFGRGVLADVSAKLLDQFVDNLESTVLTPDAGTWPDAGTAPDSDTAVAPRGVAGGTLLDDGSEGSAPGAQAEGPSTGVRRIESGPAAPVDLLDVAGSSVAARYARPAAVVLLVVVVVLVLRRRHRH